MELAQAVETLRDAAAPPGDLWAPTNTPAHCGASLLQLCNSAPTSHHNMQLLCEWVCFPPTLACTRYFSAPGYQLIHYEYQLYISCKKVVFWASGTTCCLPARCLLPVAVMAAEKLVAVIDALEGKYGMPDDMSALSRTGQDSIIQEFIKGGAIGPLVHIAMAGWPKDGDLAASTHRFDTVTDVGAAAVQHEYNPMQSRGGAVGTKDPRWRSPRRRAIVCLATMGHYG